jgi:TolB-like protein
LSRIECGELAVHVTPRAMSVLVVLGAARGAVVSRHALLDAVWPRMAVSKDALTQCIAELRRAFGDDSRQPEVIETIARVGVRLMAPVRDLEAAQPAAPAPQSNAARRASLAITPFVDTSPAGDSSTIAGALAHDLITRLAKLRSLFVIAEGSVFSLHERRVGAAEAGRILNVDYVTGGTVRFDGRRLRVEVELSEMATARVIWAETFDELSADVFVVLDDIGNRIVAAIASEIETAERNSALLRPPSSLDAWGAYHRGLWHMYRFTRRDNQQAMKFFKQAVRLDPTFGRAYAGVSFTHFQNAFQGWERRDREVDLARDAATQSLALDDRDPAAHCAMGRALWIGRHEATGAVDELRRAVDLSPNFAVGHYALGFVLAQTGDPNAAIVASDQSRLLSPFDPWMFGMLGSRAIALVRLGNFAEAADWAAKAATRPNSHLHMQALAAFISALAGTLDEAREFAGLVRKQRPSYTVDDFLHAFHFDADGVALFSRGAKALKMD